MEEIEEDFEISDLIHSKGIILEPYSHEYTELQNQLDTIQANSAGLEREADAKAGELKQLREQVLFSRRNVEEFISQQEVLKETINGINDKKEDLNEREAKHRDEISKFAGIFNELKEALSVGADWSPEQLEQRVALEKERDFVSSKYENKTNQLNSMRSDIERLYNSIKSLETDIVKLDDKIEKIDTRRSDLKKDSANLISKKEEIEKGIHDLRAVIVEGENELAERYRAKKNEDKALKSLDQTIAKTKSLMEIYINKYDQLYRTLQDLTAEMDRHNQQNDKIQKEMEEKKEHIEYTQGEISKLHKEIAKLHKLRELATQKGLEVDEMKHASELKLEALTKQVANIREVDIVSINKELDSLDKQLATLRAELSVLRKKHIGSERTSRAMVDLIHLNKTGKINLSVERKILEEEVEHYKKQIRILMGEKEKFEHDAEVTNQQYYTALEELKLQELQVQELNRKITADQTKLKQKQSLYESVRSDRNLYSKQLLDSQDEINSLKRKFRSMNHHIDQMKEEISTKDHAIVKEHFMHHSVDKERELLKNELTKIRKQVQSSEVIIENQRVEIMKLQRIIEEADQESQRQKNELSSVLSERNLLTTQLMRRNAELGEMYQKIKVQRSNLRIGERNFYRFYEELAAWQQQLKEVVLSQNETVSKLAKMHDAKSLVVQLERDLAKEKTKLRALQDELETPMNVHRWRILESSDPKRFDKIIQIQTLQKQLVVMADQVTQNDLLIQEKEKIYVELKNVIARHPGVEVEEQILVYQQTLKEKKKQLSSMNEELDMYIEQVATFKRDVNEMDSKMQKLIKKWMSRTRKSMDFN